jgi:hypothetical protein
MAITNHKGLAKALAEDTSRMAICGGDLDQLEVACEVAMDAVGNAFSLRTAKQDAGAWKAWERYCKIMKTSPMRVVIDPVADRVGFMREVVLLTNALTHFLKTRSPRANCDKAAGKTIQPQSAMNILLGVNRVLKRNYSSFIPLKSVNLALKGLMRKFVKRFGPTSLIPKRREAFTNGLINSMISMPAGAHLGGFGVLDWSSIKGCSLLASFTLAIATGFRKAELFVSDEETQVISWRLVAWFIKGKAVADPSDQQLRDLKEGDYMLITPPPSKADPFNTVWGPLPVYIPFHRTRRNAAMAVSALALKVGASARKKGPVFVDNSQQPLKARVMADAMYHWVKGFVGLEAAKLYTWHSGRIFLACALSALGVKPAVIQTMLRWQTEESLRIYARMSMHNYGSLLDRTPEACVASVQTTNLPLYERFDLFLALDRTSQEACQQL